MYLCLGSTPQEARLTLEEIARDGLPEMTMYRPVPGIAGGNSRGILPWVQYPLVNRKNTEVKSHTGHEQG
jgi:hypothetical protein